MLYNFITMACSYNCSDLPNHEQVTCGNYPRGGNNAIGILKCDQSTITDFSLASEYTTALGNGDLKIVETLRAWMPEASETTSENPDACGSETILDGFDHTVEWKDANVTSNTIEFYNSLNEGEYNLIVFNCSEDTVYVVEDNVSFIGKLTNPESNKERQMIGVVGSWSTGPDGITTFYDAPAGIFNQ